MKRSTIIKCARCRQKHVARRYSYCVECDEIIKNSKIDEKYKDIQRNSHLRTHYGIGLEEYKFMYEEQNGLCAICCKPETKQYPGNKEPVMLSVDHDHITGKVRGLLCRDCNIALGLLQDDLERINKIIQYLRRSK